MVVTGFEPITSGLLAPVIRKIFSGANIFTIVLLNSLTKESQIGQLAGSRVIDRN